MVLIGKCLRTTQYLNEETGEIFETKRYVDMQYNDEGYLFHKGKNSVRTYLDTSLPKEFSWAECGRIEAMKHYIMRDNQLLVYRSNNKIKPIKTSDIERIIGASNRQTVALIKKMKKYEVIKEASINGTTYFCFNPIYGMKDKRLTPTVFVIFQETIKKHIPYWVFMRFLEDAKELDIIIRK